MERVTYLMQVLNCYGTFNVQSNFQMVHLPSYSLRRIVVLEVLRSQ